MARTRRINSAQAIVAHRAPPSYSLVPPRRLFHLDDSTLQLGVAITRPANGYDSTTCLLQRAAGARTPWYRQTRLNLRGGTSAASFSRKRLFSYSNDKGTSG